MGVGHEGGEITLNAEELVNGVVVPLIWFAFGFPTEVPIEDMGGKLLRWGLSVERVGMEVGHILFSPIVKVLLVSWRLVPQPAVMRGESELLHQPNRGK